MEEIISDSPGLSEISAQDGGYGGRTSTPNMNKRNKRNSSSNSNEFKIIKKQIGGYLRLFKKMIQNFDVFFGLRFGENVSGDFKAARGGPKFG